MKKIFISLLIIAVMTVIAQTSAQQSEEKPKNLKVLSKNLSRKEVVDIMKVYSRSLGVKCGFCHKHDNGTPPNFDFVSDEKWEKLTARKMMKMTDAVNKKYIAKIGEGKFEKITCVTCHMGNMKPMVSVDSLPRKPQERKD
jgi:hypothetical protein